jgi:hypothetical protein
MTPNACESQINENRASSDASPGASTCATEVSQKRETALSTTPLNTHLHYHIHLNESESDLLSIPSFIIIPIATSFS